MNVAIIPARGGSKRIPRKNIREFCGRPMIAWSIKAANESGLFDHVIVSTDDEEIAQIATREGAEVPFRRPPELANDHAGTLPVIRHAVNWLTLQGAPVTHACCIYATAPFLRPADLAKAKTTLDEAELDFVFSITRFSFPIQRALKLGSDHSLSMFWPEHELTRSQDLPPAYHDAGQFYWGTSHAWQTSDRIYSSHCRGLELPAERVQDIDTEEDWAQAEFKFRSLQYAALT
jgi:N-acylneuraminate cytidylyltransferase